MNHKRIPNEDINNNKLLIGDRVEVVHKTTKAALWGVCEIVEIDNRRALKLEDGMFAFGLGNHYLIKQ